MPESAVFPLGNAYLPGDFVALNIFEPRYVQMLTDVMAGSRSFVSVLIERGSEVGGGERRHDHGVDVIVDSITEENSVFLVTGRATSVCTISHWLEDAPYPRAETHAQLNEPLSDSQRFDVASSLTLLAQIIRSIVESLSTSASSFTLPPQTVSGLATIAAGRWWDQSVEEVELWHAFWLLARILPSGPFDKYALLTPGSLDVRLKRLKQAVDHVHEVVSFRFEQ